MADSTHVVEYIPAAEMVRCCDICLSITYLSFTQYWNAVDSSYFMVILLLTL